MQHGFIVWIFIGAIAGWVAGLVVKGSGFGILADILVGIVGAVIGGFLAHSLGIEVSGGLIGSFVVALVGACILVFAIRLIKRAV